MIGYAYPLHPTEGYRLDLRCPVLLCDHCHRPIDKDSPGNLLWSPDDERQFHVHKGPLLPECAAAYRHVPRWQPIEDWLQQLQRNHAEPLHQPGGTDVLVPGLVPGTGDTFQVHRWDTGGAK